MILARLFNIWRGLFEPNPVLRREVRARWRGNNAFLALLLVAMPLALGMTLFYGQKMSQLTRGELAHSESSYAQPTVIGSTRFLNPSGSIAPARTYSQQLGTIGYSLFEKLTTLQIIAWLLIAPAMAAPMIALERERGLLDALLLANLPPRRVVLGKWLAALAFIFLMLLVPLPVIAICFYFGGVGPDEFLRAATITAMTALTGTALGLWCSSRRTRPAHAQRDAFLFISLWTMLTILPSHSNYLIYNAPLIVRQGLSLISLSHPYYFATEHLLTNEPVDWPLRNLTAAERGYYSLNQNIATLATGPLNTPIAVSDAWFGHLFIQVLLTMLFLLAAMRAASRPASEIMMAERHRWTDRLRAHWQQQRAIRAAALSARQRERERLSIVAQETLLLEIPLLSQRSFDNPVFGRELRGKTRWRSVAPPLQILRVVLGVAATYAYIAILGRISGGEMRDGWNILSQLGLAGLTLYAGATGASAFTRERESGTWESVRLSLLPPESIVKGKYWPIIITSGVLSLPLWLALVLDGLSRSVVDYGTLVCRIFIAFLVVIGALYFATASGMLVSWYSRRTPVSIGVTLSFLLILFVALPSLEQPSPYSPNAIPTGAYFSPFKAINSLNFRYSYAPPDSIFPGFCNGILLIGAGSFIFFLLSLAMARKPQEESDAARAMNFLRSLLPKKWRFRI